VHPGIIDTPIWGKISAGAASSGQNAPIDLEERAKLATPLGRVGNDTMKAIRDYQAKTGLLPADGYGGLKVLARLRQGS